MKFESLSIGRWLAILFCAQLIEDKHAGLLQHNGACGWGFCAPTVAGWLWITAVWLLLVFSAAVLAKSLSSLLQVKFNHERKSNA